MSRHFFDCEMTCEVRVILGYEEAANGYFLEVKWIGADPDQGPLPLLYDWTNDPSSAGDDLDYYRGVLKTLGLVVPESMFTAVQEDAVGSDRCAQHFADGPIVEGVSN